MALLKQALTVVWLLVGMLAVVGIALLAGGQWVGAGILVLAVGAAVGGWRFLVPIVRLENNNNPLSVSVYANGISIRYVNDSVDLAWGTFSIVETAHPSGSADLPPIVDVRDASGREHFLMQLTDYQGLVARIRARSGDSA